MPGAMRAYDTGAGSLALDTVTLPADHRHVVAILAAPEAPGFAHAVHEVDVFHLREDRIAAHWSFSEDRSATDRLRTLSSSAPPATPDGPPPRPPPR